MVFVHGLGHFHPDNEITNRFLADLDIGTNEEWILERTGIRSRRTVLPLDYIRSTRNRDVRAADEAAELSNAELGCRAAEMAIARAGVDRSEIGMVIAGGSLPGHASPAEACTIAAALELEVPAFDVRSACTSFASILQVVSMMRDDALPPYVLIAVPETVTRAIDYDDRAAAVLWGDAAAAAVVSTTVPARAVVTQNSLRSSPTRCKTVTIPWAGHFSQEGPTVQSFAIKTSVKLLRGLQRDAGRDAERLHFIGHQANLLMLENVCRSCDIPDDRHHSNVVDKGNTATAGSASVLSGHWGRFETGDRVAIVGVGAGLTWSTTLLSFEEAR